MCFGDESRHDENRPEFPRDSLDVGFALFRQSRSKFCLCSLSLGLLSNHSAHRLENPTDRLNSYCSTIVTIENLSCNGCLTLQRAEWQTRYLASHKISFAKVKVSLVDMTSSKESFSIALGSLEGACQYLSELRLPTTHNISTRAALSIPL
jgi:hypothetical protein